jgi:large subunit ribosomal protein L29
VEKEALKGKTLSELYKLLENNKKEQFSMRIQMKTAQGFKPHLIRAVRKDIARIKTRLSQVKAGRE